MPRAIALRSLLLSILSGLLVGLSFPPFQYSFLVWIALVPLLWIPFEKPFSSFKTGWISGTAAHLIIFFWLWKTFQAARIPFFTTLPSWFFLSLLMGLYTAVFMAALFWIKSDGLRPWVGAALWVALDHIKEVALTGFPWGLLSHSQVFHSSLIQLSSLTGAAGITFLIVLINLQIASVLKNMGPRRWRGLIVSLLLVGLCLAGGSSRLKENYDPSRSPLRVAVLQGNIDQYQKWNTSYESGIRKIYDDLTVSAAMGKPDVMIWPESSVPGWYPNEKTYTDWVRQISTTTKSYQVIGAVSSRDGHDYNAAFQVDPSGFMEYHYEKVHLVPFGEYIPFGNFLKKFVPYLGQLGTFTAGKGPVIFDLNEIKLAPNICYEAVFPSLVRRSVLAGGEVILNLTNDGWYLDTGAPMQHYGINILRAVENGRPVIRAANTGISAAIDSYGREIFRSQLNERGVYFADISVPETPIQTIYGKFGDWFTYLCWIFTLFVYSGLCLANLKSKPKN